MICSTLLHDGCRRARRRSGELESFSEELGGGLEYPHYTRPAEFRGWKVPDVLLSGDHAKIDACAGSAFGERPAPGVSSHVCRAKFALRSTGC